MSRKRVKLEDSVKDTGTTDDNERTNGDTNSEEVVLKHKKAISLKHDDSMSPNVLTSHEMREKLLSFIESTGARSSNGDFRKTMLLLERKDRDGALRPDVVSPFKNMDDAFARLSAYRTFQTTTPHPNAVRQSNQQMMFQTRDLVHKAASIEKRLLESRKRVCSDAVSLEMKVMMGRDMCAMEQDRLRLERLRRARILYPERTLSIIHGLDNEFVSEPKVDPDELVPQPPPPPPLDAQQSSTGRPQSSSQLHPNYNSSRVSRVG